LDRPLVRVSADGNCGASRDRANRSAPMLPPSDVRSSSSQVAAIANPIEAIYGQRGPCGRSNRPDEFAQPVRAGAIHLSQRFIGDRTALILKECAVFRQHGGGPLRQSFDVDHPAQSVNAVLTQRTLHTHSYVIFCDFRVPRCNLRSARPYRPMSIADSFYRADVAGTADPGSSQRIELLG
jgi:hypothetical protein